MGVAAVAVTSSRPRPDLVPGALVATSSLVPYPVGDEDEVELVPDLVPEADG